MALYFAGIKLDLDDIRMEQLMDTYRRAEIIASHPVATAKYFHLLISNILTTMIRGGVLGPIKAYFGTVESQGRGSLHLHLLIWLDHDMKPADLKENIQDDHFREKLRAYLEDIIKEDLDDFKEKRSFQSLSNIHLSHLRFYFSSYVIALRPSPSHDRASQDDIYSALRTIDLTSKIRNESRSPAWSTPRKQQPVYTIPNCASTISFTSPSPHPSGRTPTRSHAPSSTTLRTSKKKK